ncbi:hypothetical protein IV203_030392 [Nitzschia inconspicua]|uniref:Uncharacterized protein n=1 Tax=Nitzschia inconspicua TaxID=303405 RepID=A0A9K3Q1U2_9STRA|nr:hypothetical protein IV203_030392 [Nitzschia inconspicua]
MDNTDDVGNNTKNKGTNDQITYGQQVQQEEEKKEDDTEMNDDDEYDNDDKEHQPVKKKRKKISFASVSTVERKHTDHHPDGENNDPITTSFHHTKCDHIPSRPPPLGPEPLAPKCTNPSP